MTKCSCRILYQVSDYILYIWWIIILFYHLHVSKYEDAELKHLWAPQSSLFPSGVVTAGALLAVITRKHSTCQWHMLASFGICHATVIKLYLFQLITETDRQIECKSLLIFHVNPILKRSEPNLEGLKLSFARVQGASFIDIGEV